MESLLLSSGALPSPTMCRFIPALSVPGFPGFPVWPRIFVPQGFRSGLFVERGDLVVAPHLLNQKQIRPPIR